MNPSDIQITIQTLDQLYEKIRVRKNEEMRVLKELQESSGQDLSAVIRTISGSLFAYGRKIDLVKKLFND